MGLFDRSTKEQEIEEEQIVAEEDIEEEGRIISNPFICPFCNNEIRKVIVIDVNDQDDEEVRLICCPNCRKVLGGKTIY